MVARALIKARWNICATRDTSSRGWPWWLAAALLASVAILHRDIRALVDAYVAVLDSSSNESLSENITAGQNDSESRTVNRALRNPTSHATALFEQARKSVCYSRTEQILQCFL